MPNPLHDFVLPAARERSVLVANHLLTAHPGATTHLHPYAGRTLRLKPSGWSGPLPEPPPLVLRVTPAGLVESVEIAAEDAGCDLEVTVDMSKPLQTAGRLAQGQRLDIRIEGDAAFAGAVHWIFDNVRWDAVADIENVFGPTAAGVAARLGRDVGQVVQGLQRAASQLTKGFGGDRSSGV